MQIWNILLFVSIWIAFCDSLPNWSSEGMYCRTQDDCPPNHCCVIGFVRYSFPQCMPFGEIDEWCRLYNEPENKTLVFPNGRSYEFSRIYTQFCPCADGLVCDRAKCALHSNRIHSMNSLFDDEFY